MPSLIAEPIVTMTENRLQFDGSPETATNFYDDELLTPKAILPAAETDSQIQIPNENSNQSGFEASYDLGQDHKSLRIRPLVKVTTNEAPVRRFKVLQQFEGTVTQITQDGFCADLYDLTDVERPVEVAEIMLDEFSAEDRTLIDAGSIFYWIVGIETSPAGQIRRVSEMRLRRNPSWSKRDINRVKAKGRELFDLFNSANCNNERLAQG